MVTMAVTKGFDLDWISELDVLSFRALVESLERVASAEMIRAAYVARAAQADQKDFKSVIRDWTKSATPGGVDPNARSGQDLLNQYGRGI